MINYKLKRLLLAGLFGMMVMTTHAAVTVYEFDNSEQETRYQALINDFRCPTCQNQNLAGSDAPIAQDLKQKTYEMIKEGRSDGEIRTYMFERYGDYISYKPPVRPSTWILWFFPPIVLVVVLIAWIYKSRGKKAKELNKPKALALTEQEQRQLDELLANYQEDTNTNSTQKRE